jgi:F420-dependent oxidoreductase-like protein
MLEVAIMIEGQNGLNWKRWQHIAGTVEDCGYVGLYRSDHYTNVNPPDQDSLECWTSLTWLASHTRRIEFGPLVSPVSFRHPTQTARMAAAVDDLSGGRLILGVGAGWQEREHTNYGWDLLTTRERFIRLDEGLSVISSLLKSDTPVNFRGKYYPITDGILLPRPSRPGGPPILVGGNGLRQTLPLVAKYAQEWNSLMIQPAEFARLNRRLDEYIIGQDRQAAEVSRSMMTGCVFGADPKEVQQKVHKRTHGARSVADLRQRGMVVGAADEIVAQLKELADVGVQRVMLQWLDLDDLAGLETMAAGILPHLSH